MVKYKEKYNELEIKHNKTLGALRISDHFGDLAEYFIIQNGLEAKFIDFINSIAEYEKDESYRESAQYKKEEYEIEDMIEDDYGLMKEMKNGGTDHSWYVDPYVEIKDN